MTLAQPNIQPAVGEPDPDGVVVNDVHSRLNRTVVDRVVIVRSTADARNAILAAGMADKPVCVSGGRHAMGGQQFAHGGVLLDTRAYRGVRRFDRDRGLIEVESGITLWYGQSRVETYRPELHSVWSTIGLEDHHPARVTYTDGLVDELAKCIVKGAVQKEDLPRG